MAIIIIIFTAGSPKDKQCIFLCFYFINLIHSFSLGFSMQNSLFIHDLSSSKGRCLSMNGILLSVLLSAAPIPSTVLLLTGNAIFAPVVRPPSDLPGRSTASVSLRKTTVKAARRQKRKIAGTTQRTYSNG